METLGWVLAVLLVVVAAVAWWRAHSVSTAARARQAELEKQVEGQTQVATQSKRQADEASSALERAQAELAEAIRQRDDKAVAKALWKLELDRTERQWADVVVLNAEPLGEMNTGKQLSTALSCEVDRLREEVGVAIHFDGELDGDLDVEVALGALRITGEVLSLGAKMADEIAIEASLQAVVGDSQVDITITCDGWDSELEKEEAEMPGGDVQALMQDLQASAGKLNGTLDWEQPSIDLRRASLQLTASKSPTSV